MVKLGLQNFNNVGYRIFIWPFADTEISTGAEVLDFDKLDKIIKRCLPKNLKLTEHVNLLMIHDCRPTSCKG